MKILKPGKVEQRKFVCEECGCVFVANEVDLNSSDSAAKIKCPCERRWIRWTDGEPYEEPVQDDRERLSRMLFDSTPQCTIGRYDIAADYLIEHGVTFREG